jgi:hypothetical protein
MKRLPVRVEPFSTYLERRRKGRSIQLLLRASRSTYRGFHPSTRIPARSGVCRSNGKPSLCCNR